MTAKLRQVLDTCGPEAVLHLNYAGNTGTLTCDFPTRLWSALGATRTDNALCSKSGHEALALHYGTSYGLLPEELLSRKLIVFWGFNAALSAAHLFRLALEARKKGAHVAAVDPRESETAGKAATWIAPRPGSDVALAYGIARFLIEHECADSDFIRAHTRGFEAFREEVMKWTPALVEDATGLAWSAIERLAGLYAELKPCATMIGIGFQKSLQGAESTRAVSLIPALLGLHRGFFYSNDKRYSVDISFLSGASLTRRKPRIVSQVALGALLAEGAFRFIFTSGMNPAVSVPDQNAFRRGLSRDDLFLAVHDTHWTETCTFADVVLPAPTCLEKEDLIIPWSHNYVRLSPKITEPAGESRDEIWLMQEMARCLELSEEWLYASPMECLKHALRESFGDGTWDDLKRGKTLRLRCRPLDEYPTPSGKIEFYSQKAEKSGLPPLPAQRHLVRAEGEFVLLSSALSEYTHSQFQEVFGKIPSKVKIHPGDAARFGIRTGDEVQLENNLGRVRLTAEVSDGQQEGTLWAPKLCLDNAGAPLNSLIPGECQQIGKGSTINSTLVSSVRKVSS